MKTRLLLVDDNTEFLHLTRILFQQTDQNFGVVERKSVKDALDILKHDKFDVIIAEYLRLQASIY
jgi:CheY-like chemotaxis protein